MNEKLANVAIGYVRVSSQEQARSGRGLAVQAEAIREHCKRAGLRLPRVERDEARSGSNGLDTRPGLAAALAAVEGGEAGVLVVDDYSRLARDLILQETTIARLAESGVRVVSVTEPEGAGDDATRTLIRQVLGAVNQYNQAVTRAKMEAGRRAAVAAGRRGQGAPPYGFTAERGQLLPNPNEQAVLARMRALRGASCSLRNICRRPKRRGHTRPSRPLAPGLSATCSGTHARVTTTNNTEGTKVTITAIREFVRLMPR